MFLNYRRADTRHVAGRLYDRIVARFGMGSVFMDVDSITAGLDFVDAIEAAVAECDVLLALIGPDWLSVIDEQGRRRLDNPTDYIVLEIAAALQRQIRVIPILVDGAHQPRRDDLPKSLARLARHQALRLEHDSFATGATHLLDILDTALAPTGNSQAPAPAKRQEPAPPTSKDEWSVLPFVKSGNVRGLSVGCNNSYHWKIRFEIRKSLSRMFVNEKLWDTWKDNRTSLYLTPPGGTRVRCDILVLFSGETFKKLTLSIDGKVLYIEP